VCALATAGLCTAVGLAAVGIAAANGALDCIGCTGAQRVQAAAGGAAIALLAGKVTGLARNKLLIRGMLGKGPWRLGKESRIYRSDTIQFVKTVEGRFLRANDFAWGSAVWVGQSRADR
jgi:hypothetical protein